MARKQTSLLWLVGVFVAVIVLLVFVQKSVYESFTAAPTSTTPQKDSVEQAIEMMQQKRANLMNYINSRRADYPNFPALQARLQKLNTDMNNFRIQYSRVPKPTHKPRYQAQLNNTFVHEINKFIQDARIPDPKLKNLRLT